MLSADRQTFLDFTSGDAEKVRAALGQLNARPRGHFEDHPLSRSLVKSRVEALLHLWKSDLASPDCRRWVAQMIADARIADPAVRPVVEEALADRSCGYLPTLLYLVGSNADAFAGIGAFLLPLAKHADREVRWRVAWAISKMKVQDEQMRRAINVLSGDPDPTTQTYVRACGA